MNPRSIARALLLVATCVSCDRATPGTPNPPAPSPGGLRPGLSEVGPVDEARIVAGQTIYVPAYSHVYTADGAQPLNLATTLFVRNVDPNRPIILSRVRYIDSGGKLLREFLKTPVRVDPLASADFFVREGDVTGGASPSFLVDWVADGPALGPIAESVMIGTVGTQGISFACPGRVTASRPGRP